MDDVSGRRTPRTGNPYQPISVLDVDLDAKSVRAVDRPDNARQDLVWALVRMAGYPVFAGELSVASAEDKAVLAACTKMGLPQPTGQLRSGAWPGITVVLCTRNRVPQLRNALRALGQLAYAGPWDLVVVDNDETSTSRVAVAEVTADWTREVSYVHEARPGLSRARNTGLAHGAHDWLAFIDDDELADPTWLTWLGLTIESHPEAEVITGFIPPAQLRTSAQYDFERFGGHAKGRWITPAVLTAHNCEPLFPSPAFGAGGNMATTRRAAARVGGFDEALGAGTRVGGGEDTLFLSEHLLNGGTIVYEPAVVVWHRHRSDASDLIRQLSGYGAGLTAMYTALLRRHPPRALTMLALAPKAISFVRPGGTRDQAAEGLPSSIMRDNRRSMLRGPKLYAQEIWSQRRSRLKAAR